jgi:hypothetical protein
MANPRILYDNRLDDGTPAASTTATGFDVANLTDWRPYTKWQPTALPATVTVDAGSALSADYWVIWGHDLFTQGATIQLRKSNDNFAVNDVLVDSITPTDDEPIVRYFTSTSERYWRFNITGTTMPTLAIASVGEHLELPDGVSDLFDPIGRKPMGPFNRSVEGHPLGRSIEYQKWTQAVALRYIDWSWMRTDWIPAWEAHLKSTPFVYDWNPGDATYGGESRLVAIEDGFTGPHHPGQVADLLFTMTGII